MKKKIYLLILAFTGIGASAQITVKSGIRAGVNFSQLTQTELDSKTDFYAGGLAEIKLSRFYILQPEVTYSRQGAEGNYTYYDFNIGAGRTDYVDFSLQYLSLGLMNKFTFNDQINIHFGPTLDFLLNNNHEFLTAADVGVMAGIGYKLPFGLEIEARVKKGFADVLDDFYSYDIYSYSQNTNTNFVVQLGVSYSFDVKGTSR